MTRICLTLLLLLGTIGCNGAKTQTETQRPNIILIMTDDQGYGDLGVMGNPVIRTPNLDAMAQRSAQMTTFYVSPVCAPTRASLMTGRYNYRTRAIDTFIGRAMMEPEETTLAELLRDAGYQTGLFGKWHLGDAYPMRPQDQGFEEVLMHRGGGIGQPSDPPGGEGKYTDAILFHNGEAIQTQGYCTDVYFDRAFEWMKQHQEEPFFAYIATNAPHGPFHDVPEDLLAEYQQMDLSDERFPEVVGHPIERGANLDVRARIYSMITNIDDNVGRLFERLDTLSLTDNTIVIFMIDNGPDGRRYIAGMKGRKSYVHEGGVRSPFFAHWPGTLEPGPASDAPAAHIDVLPTLLEAAGVEKPDDLSLDGRSFWPLLTREADTLPERNLVIQTHRGNRPVRYHHFLIRNDRWKMLHASGFGKETFEGEPVFELYDLQNDPYEMQDVAAEQPEMVAGLKADYDTWFDDVGSTRADNYAPPRIHIGAPQEPVTVLTRQDWRHTKGRPWAGDSNGFWELYVTEAGAYEIRLRFPALETKGIVSLKLNNKATTALLEPGATTHTFEDIEFSAGDLRLQATLSFGDTTKGPWQVDVYPTNSP